MKGGALTLMAPHAKKRQQSTQSLLLLMRADRVNSHP